MPNKKGFTIVELMVAIIIFTIGFLSSYLLIYSAINSSIRSKNEIVASNIAREQIELIKNVRDTNWLKSNVWNDIGNYISPYGAGNLDAGYYMIENDYTGSFPIKITKLNPSFHGTKADVLNVANNIGLYIDGNGRYSHFTTTGAQKTNFYSFVKVEPLVTINEKHGDAPLTVTGALKIESSVANTERGYNEFHINTIITDWKK